MNGLRIFHYESRRAWLFLEAKINKSVIKGIPDGCLVANFTILLSVGVLRNFLGFIALGLSDIFFFFLFTLLSVHRVCSGLCPSACTELVASGVQGS